MISRYDTSIDFYMIFPCHVLYGLFIMFVALFFFRPIMGTVAGLARMGNWDSPPTAGCSVQGVCRARRLSKVGENQNHGPGPSRHRAPCLSVLGCSGGSWPLRAPSKIVFKIYVFFQPFADPIFGLFWTPKETNKSLMDWCPF